MEHEVIIRKVEMFDAKKINHAFNEVAIESGFLDSTRNVTLDQTLEYIKEAMNQHYIYYLAEVNEIVIGWCDIRIDYEKKSGQLGLGVLQNYRGLGIGKTLSQTALKKAKTMGIEEVMLYVKLDNKIAVNLYKKIGFYTCSVEDGRILMKLKLNEN